MTRRMGAPNYDGDFWSDAVILEPYPVYDELRRLCRSKITARQSQASDAQI